MEGLVMAISFAAGIAAAFFTGVKIGKDQGIREGMEETVKALGAIQKEGEEEIRKIEKAIDADCPWR